MQVAVSHQSLRIRSIVINRQDEVGFRKIVHRRLALSLQTARGYCKCLDGSVGLERNSKKLDSLRSVDDLRQGLWRIKSSTTTLPGSKTMDLSNANESIDGSKVILHSGRHAPVTRQRGRQLPGRRLLCNRLLGSCQYDGRQLPERRLLRNRLLGSCPDEDFLAS